MASRDAKGRLGEALDVRRSLSAKLLVLTIGFVLLAELVVLIPSVSAQRVRWLEARIEAAHLVGLALESADEEMIEPEVKRRLFATANILGVTINMDGANMLILAPEIDRANPPKMRHVDLATDSPLRLLAGAWATAFSRGDALIRVAGESAFAPGEQVEIVVSQRAMRAELLIYARNIFFLSLIISGLTAGLVYWSLDRLIVERVRRLTRSMTKFEAAPDNPASVIAPSGRRDEIGVAERTLAALERRLQDLLGQRRRLAALGAGIAKISHDLRNILASAQLMSDRLAQSDDPKVRRLSPRLVQALDRAIALSRDTLHFGRLEPGRLDIAPVRLRGLVAAVLDDGAASGVAARNEIPEDLRVAADRDQLYRALSNLVRNAAEALTESGGERRKDLIVHARRTGASVEIEIEDNACGVPEEARAGLFEPFSGSSKPGGAGLGLAIAYEIARAHGGDLVLARTGPEGSVFRLVLPAGG